jgi:hypothetical protein
MIECCFPSALKIVRVANVFLVSDVSTDARLER